MIGAFFGATGIFDAVELGNAVFQQDTIQHGLALFLGHAATHAHGIFTDKTVGGVHQPVGQLTIGGEQHHAGGVDIQPADLDPAHPLQARQVIEHRRAPFRVVARAHFSRRLVVHNDPLNGIFFGLHFNHPAIYT